MNARSHILLVLGLTLASTAVLADGITLPMKQLTVTAQSLATDLRIQSEVMRVLSSNETLSGRVSVEARDQVVTLGGHLLTEGQARRAGRAALGVDGVRHVVNEIRPMVGAVTH